MKIGTVRWECRETKMEKKIYVIQSGASQSEVYRSGGVRGARGMRSSRGTWTMQLDDFTLGPQFLLQRLVSSEGCCQPCSNSFF